MKFTTKYVGLDVSKEKIADQCNRYSAEESLTVATSTIWLYTGLLAR